MLTKKDEYPKLYRLTKQDSISAMAQEIAQMKEHAWVHDGWPLDTEKIEAMLERGELTEVDW